jgi:hypothetical protein
MFEVGKSYMFTILESGEDGPHETEQWFEVAAIDGTLLTLLGPDYSDPRFDDLLPDDEVRDSKREETILNTASAFFLRAKPAKTEDE